ncbi:MAG TPA: sulfatase-like hydrolase/transferase [Bryobacteraceae bacterium]|nr:sulfatase-like hydrolase/transferase [Bryobacteraceae bacterium]
MRRTRGRLSYSIRWGAVHGFTVWSAYCAAEFVFASLLFALARPYSEFASWHWSLTWLLVAGFLAAGVVLGALAGAAVYFFGDGGSRSQLEQAATLTLVLSFLANVVAHPPTLSGWGWLLTAGLAFAILLALGLRSRDWHARVGYLTNPWVISGFLLGLGQEAVVLSMGTADQLGSHIGGLEWLLASLLALLVIVSVMAGRAFRSRFESTPWVRAASFALAPFALILLVAASQAVSSARTTVHAASPETPPSAGPASQPNLLLIVMDTVRADHLGIDGYDRATSPNLRRLARDSVLYTRAMSASDFTLTSHASIFTGTYPSFHGAYCDPPSAAFGRRLDDSLPTLAGLLRDRGYYTLAVAANLYMRAEFGLDRGFERFEIPRPVPILDAETWYMLRRPMRRVLGYGFDTAQFDRLYSRSQDINRELLGLLARRNGSRAPFFVFLNYMDAHFPYAPPAPYDREFPGKNRRLTADDLDLEQQAIAAGGPVPSNYRPHAISQYDGGIAYMDAQIGQLMDWLKQQRIYDNTMVVVTSDHGEAFGERNHTGHANSPYQNLLHVALMVKYPASAGAPAGTVVETPVSTIDIAPTVLKVLGSPIPPTMVGQNLLQTDPAAKREFFAETFPCATLQSPECPRGCIARAVYSWPYKFITSTNGRRQLYDLSADPNETHDLLRTDPREAKQLNADLRAWVKTFPGHSRQKLQLNPEAIQRLKSLGYVQ